jgi:hypothetical protein
MLTIKEYIVLIVSYIIVFVTIWFLFKEFSIKANLSHIVVLSLLPTYTIKGLYDIINRTGYKKMYCFSEETNQKLRYLAFFVELGFAIFIFYGFIVLREY